MGVLADVGRVRAPCDALPHSQPAGPVSGLLRICGACDVERMFASREPRRCSRWFGVQQGLCVRCCVPLHAAGGGRRSYDPTPAQLPGACTCTAAPVAQLRTHVPLVLSGERVCTAARLVCLCTLNAGTLFRCTSLWLNACRRRTLALCPRFAPKASWPRCLRRSMRATRKWSLLYGGCEGGAFLFVLL